MILRYNEFINETLNSYDIDIVVNKLKKLFSKYSLPKKELGTGNSDDPYYTIVNDRDMIKRQQDEYKQGTSD